MKTEFSPLRAVSWQLYNQCMAKASPKVALDIGANDGGYTKTLLDHGFTVHAFEPVPAMFTKMVLAHGANSKAILNMCGLSDQPGIVKDVRVLEAWTLGQPGDGGLQASPNLDVAKPFDLLLNTMDAYMVGEPVGLIKLDVDGYEPRVLRGAERTIAKYRPPILCEISCYIEKLGCPAREFCDLVFGLGYNMVSMDGNYVAHGWGAVEPYWPHHSSYDVMLMPA